MQSSQRAKEQCGANFCMTLAASRLTTTCTPITACTGMASGGALPQPCLEPLCAGGAPSNKGAVGQRRQECSPVHAPLTLEQTGHATSRMQPMHLWPCPRANLDVQPVPVHSPGQPPEHASTVQHLRPRTPPAQARLCTHPHWSTLSMRPPKRNPSGQPSHTPLSTPSPGAHLPRTAAHGPQASHPLPALTMLGSAQRRPQEARPPPPLPAGQSDAVLLLIGSSLANGEADPRGGRALCRRSVPRALPPGSCGSSTARAALRSACACVHRACARCAARMHKGRLCDARAAPRLACSECRGVHGSGSCSSFCTSFPFDAIDAFDPVAALRHRRGQSGQCQSSAV